MAPVSGGGGRKRKRRRRKEQWSRDGFGFLGVLVVTSRGASLSTDEGKGREEEGKKGKGSIFSPNALINPLSLACLSPATTTITTTQEDH